MKKKFLIGLCLCFCLQTQQTFADIDIAPGILPQAGTINTHDIQTIMKFEAEKQIQQDYRKHKQTQKEKKEQLKQKKEKAKVEKAKIEEYATKGVYVENIEVTPSQILTVYEIENIINDYTKTNVKMEQLQEAVNKINKLYLEKGFVTARAFLPPQTIENGVIRIELVEGKVGNVTITDNKWTKTKYIEDRLGLNKGDIFNIKQYEQDLMIFNRYNDNVELTTTLMPGQSQMGTTDVDVQTHEKLPFHVTALMDNAGRSTIGKYRGGLMLQDDSLFGYRDRLTVGAYANRYSVTPFADYNIPVNKKDGRIGASFSSSNSKIGHGPYEMFNIRSRSLNYSLYYTQPIYRKPWTELSSTTSISYKKAATSFDHVDLYRDNITSAQTGLNFRYDTAKGIWYLNQNVSYAFPILDNDSNYLKVDGGLLRLHDFGHGFIGTLRGNYQFIPNKRVVPYVDQFMAGGSATARGYSEGLLVGRDGYLLSAELQFPIGPREIKSRNKSENIPFLGNFLKGFVFADHAGVFPYKGTGEGSRGYDQNDFLMSLGCGFKINLPKDISVRLSWGFPVMNNSHEEVNRWGRFHFELSLTPDFDYFLSRRHPKKDVERVKLDDNTKVATVTTTQKKYIKNSNIPNN
ncbi:ShlB/FhaC/HecB family hemolysin secretion/activation protein [bacterium]|nr:ShlB/FhaC/HecB family hemolysin secretion/activation protein [bacterium]